MFDISRERPLNNGRSRKLHLNKQILLVEMKFD